MSIKCMTHVWESSQAEGTALLMLLAIADHANDDGVCWPSLAALAARARVSLRQAKRLVAQLEELGEIEIRRGVGRNQTSVYVVAGIAAVSPSTRAKVSRMTPFTEKGDIQRAQKVTSSAEKVTPSAGKGDIAMSPDPLEPSIEPSVEPKDRTSRAHASTPATPAPPAPPHAPEPPPVPAAPAAPTDDQALTRTIAERLEHVGVLLSPFTVDQYLALAHDYGIHALLAGISAAADNGKQHSFSYVRACTRNKAQGTSSAQPANGRRPANGSGFFDIDETLYTAPPVDTTGLDLARLIRSGI